MSFVVAPVPVVIDVSFAVEALGPDPRYLEAWNRWIAEGAETYAPPHFWAETANALLRGVRLPVAQTLAGFDAIVAVGVDTIDRGLPGIRSALALANARSLTVYDALYLDLVVDIDARLATLDRALAKAAIAEGIELVEV